MRISSNPRVDWCQSEPRMIPWWFQLCYGSSFLPRDLIVGNEFSWPPWGTKPPLFLLLFCCVIPIVFNFALWLFSGTRLSLHNDTRHAPHTPPSNSLSALDIENLASRISVVATRTEQRFSVQLYKNANGPRSSKTLLNLFLPCGYAMCEQNVLWEPMRARILFCGYIGLI